MRTLHGHEESGEEGRGSGSGRGEGRRDSEGSVWGRSSLGASADGGCVPSPCVKESKGFRAPGFLARRLQKPRSGELDAPGSGFCRHLLGGGFRLPRPATPPPLDRPRPRRPAPPPATPRGGVLQRWSSPAVSRSPAAILNDFLNSAARGGRGSPEPLGSRRRHAGQVRCVHRGQRALALTRLILRGVRWSDYTGVGNLAVQESVKETKKKKKV